MKESHKQYENNINRAFKLTEFLNELSRRTENFKGTKDAGKYILELRAETLKTIKDKNYKSKMDVFPLCYDVFGPKSNVELIKIFGAEQFNEQKLIGFISSSFNGVMYSGTSMLSAFGVRQLVAFMRPPTASELAFEEIYRDLEIQHIQNSVRNSGR